MSGAFIIEISEETAGLALPAGDHQFRFAATDPRYASLDGRMFSSVGAIERAAEQLRRNRCKEQRSRAAACDRGGSRRRAA